MPLIAAMLLNAAFGLLASWAASRELRASPRSVGRLRGFSALAAHELIVVAPALLYLLLRHGDWMLSYALDAARVPSAFGVLLAVVHALVALGAFSVGAHWIRTQRPRAAAVAALACVGLAAAGAVLLRERVLWVGTHVQFRAGFGMRPLFSSRLAAVIGLVGFVWTAAAAHLIRSLRDAVKAPTPER